VQVEFYFLTIIFIPKMAYSLWIQFPIKVTGFQGFAIILALFDLAVCSMPLILEK
jgi:hypothetical protein